MRVATYVRVSTKDQNLDNQRIQLQRFIEFKGWKFIEEYKDKISGKVKDRPGLDKLLQDARKKHFDVVLVVKIDRLGRSLRQIIMNIDSLVHHGISIVTVDQGIDTTTAAGRFQLNVFASFAEYERELISERIHAGLERSKLEGKVGGRPKINYDKDLEQLICDLWDSGKSLIFITRTTKTSQWGVRKTLGENADKLTRNFTVPKQLKNLKD